jgi:DNA modification methylase
MSASTLPRRQILLGDAATVLRSLPNASVDTVITSPPYFLLRNYGEADQLGNEQTVEEYVDRLVEVCDALGAVLKPTGSLWLNLGDSYSRHDRYGAPPKSQLLAPERLVLRLVEHGFVLRNKLVWSKPNPMPASVGDRLTCSWEPIYFLVRSPRYFFDLDAIRVPHLTTRRRTTGPTRPGKYDGRERPWAGPLAGANDGLARLHRGGRAGHRLGKNPGDVWSVPTAGFAGAHFATFPTRLITRPILATCPRRTCQSCGQPWRHRGAVLQPVCACRSPGVPGVVLDPFIGSGTVAVEAERLGRDWLGIELSAVYQDLALERIASARTTSRGGDAQQQQQERRTREQRTTNTYAQAA